MKFKIFIILLVVIIILTGCSKESFLDKFSGPVNESDNSEIEVIIPSGSTTDDIADILIENELILNKLVFKLIAKDLGYDTKFKAGTYHLNQSMDNKEIIEMIAKGDVYIETVTFTIPEGFELVQIVDRLESSELIDKDKFLNELVNGEFNYKFLEFINRDTMLEGFLFPDTYKVEIGASEHEIINKMLNKFDLVFKNEYYDRLKEIDMSLNELITLASIIEREGKLDSERATISSVFHNRLDINMKLQSCATVQYILGERKEVLLFSDLEIDSPYNTYLYYGLPPSPIASPGEISIVAALYPEETEYLYFVTKEANDGSHYFSKTFEEHQNYINNKR